MRDDGDLGLSDKKILKCPFCGSDGVLRVLEGDDDFYDVECGGLLTEDDRGGNFYTVTCSNKNCIASHIADYWGSSDEAIDSWNTRRGVIPSIKAMSTSTEDFESQDNKDNDTNEDVSDSADKGHEYDNSLINVVSHILKSKGIDTDNGTYVDKDGNKYKYKVYNLSKGINTDTSTNQSLSNVYDSGTMTDTVDRYVVFDTKKMTYRYLNTICETTYRSAYLKCLGLCRAKGHYRKKINKRYQIIKIPVRLK